MFFALGVCLSCAACFINDQHAYLRCFLCSASAVALVLITDSRAHQQWNDYLRDHLHDAHTIADLLAQPDQDPDYDHPDAQHTPPEVPFASLAIGDEFVEDGIPWVKQNTTTAYCPHLCSTASFGPTDTITPSVIYRHTVPPKHRPTDPPPCPSSPPSPAPSPA